MTESNPASTSPNPATPDPGTASSMTIERLGRRDPSWPEAVEIFGETLAAQPRA